MPELPEVETFRRFIEKTSLNKRIDTIKIMAPKMLEGCTATSLRKKITDNAFDSTHRHGKFLFAGLKNGGYLMLHFGLTGHLHYVKPGEEAPSRSAIQFHFEDDSSLYFSDTRKLGKISLVKNVESFVAERGYGEDALKIAESEFVELIRKKKVAIKTVLMDQKIVAGVGNEFSDEILFQTRIHPGSLALSLSIAQLKSIFSTMRSILGESVKRRGDREKLEHYFFLDNRKAGLLCPRCGAGTASLTIGGRSSYFCPRCQRLHR